MFWLSFGVVEHGAATRFGKAWEHKQGSHDEPVEPNGSSEPGTSMPMRLTGRMRGGAAPTANAAAAAAVIVVFIIANFFVGIGEPEHLEEAGRLNGQRPLPARRKAQPVRSGHTECRCILE